MIAYKQLRLMLWHCMATALICGLLTLVQASQSSAFAQEKQITIYFVGITSPADPFHGVIARGAEQAGKDLGVNVVYIFPDKVTLSDYNNKLEQAIAAKPDGIVVLGLDEKGSEPLAQRAHELGMKLAFNPAPPISEKPLWSPDDLYISRVGSDEYSAGRAAGNRLVKAGVKGKVVCAIQIAGDSTLAARCKGVTDQLKEAGIETEVMEIANEPGQSAELLTTYLRAHPDTGAVVTLGGPPNAGSREAKKAVSRDDLLLGAFDLDTATLESIKAGEMLFTIDQQPFWRGYIPILEITHNIRYGLQQANYFLSGPSIIDKSNVEHVIELAKQGVR
jgi:simple sugar transport system substrate-binding protein